MSYGYALRLAIFVLLIRRPSRRLYSLYRASVTTVRSGQLDVPNGVGGVLDYETTHIRVRTISKIIVPIFFARFVGIRRSKFYKKDKDSRHQVKKIYKQAPEISQRASDRKKCVCVWKDGLLIKHGWRWCKKNTDTFKLLKLWHILYLGWFSAVNLDINMHVLGKVSVVKNTHPTGKKKNQIYNWKYFKAAASPAKSFRPPAPVRKTA